MLGGPLIELVLVLFFVFLTMSAIVSTLQEVWAQTFRTRAHTLQKCIRQMLADEVYGDQIYKRFFRHPRISVPGRAANQLTWIDPEDFAVAMATAVQPQDSADDCISELPASIRALKDGELKKRLRLAMPDVFRDGAGADLIKGSVTAWYNASMNKTMEIYKAETRLRLYVVAAATTVLFNVSPIKIAQQLQSQPELRSAFASAVPELSTLVLNVGDGTTTRLLGATTELDGTAANTSALTSDLSSTDLKSMLAIFECTRGRIGLPIGWPWMAEAFEGIQSRLAAANPNACAESLAKAQMSPELNERLQMLNLATADMKSAAPRTVASVAPENPVASETPVASAEPDAAPAATAPASANARPAIDLKPSAQQTAIAASMLKPTFGPNFATDPWFMVILGWLVMVVAAGQGAPFWFSLLQKLVAKRP